jgi:hypothetical protein
LAAYPRAFEGSWLADELQRSKNFKPWFKKGFWTGTVMTGVEQWLLPKLGVAVPPWTLHNQVADHTRLQPAAQQRAHRVSEARRQLDLRPPVVGVRVEHQPRGKPASAPDLERPQRARAREPGPVMQDRKAATARQACTSSCMKTAGTGW